MSLLFKDRIPTTTTVYVPVPVRDGCVGAHLAWPDATSSATITLELSSNPGAGTTDSEWKDSGLTFTGPAASAAGSLLVNVENVRQRQARIKIVTAAVTTLRIWDGTAA